MWSLRPIPADTLGVSYHFLRFAILILLVKIMIFFQRAGGEVCDSHFWQSNEGKNNHTVWKERSRPESETGPHSSASGPQREKMRCFSLKTAVILINTTAVLIKLSSPEPRLQHH